MKKGGTIKKALPKAQKGKVVKKKTPFQNYMSTTSGAVPSDTSQVFTGIRNTDNPKLDKAYYDTFYAGQENKRRTGADKVTYDSNGNRIYKKTGGAMKKMKTGGMVNTNTKVTALKTAGSNGVKSGVNPKASAQKVAKGRVGGTNKPVPRPKKGH